MDRKHKICNISETEQDRLHIVTYGISIAAKVYDHECYAMLYTSKIDWENLQ